MQIVKVGEVCWKRVGGGSLGRGRIVVDAAGDHRPVYQTPATLQGTIWRATQIYYFPCCSLSITTHKSLIILLSGIWPEKKLLIRNARKNMKNEDVTVNMRQIGSLLRKGQIEHV